MAKPIDLSGFRMDSATALKRVGKNHRDQFMWECRCDCGELFYAVAANIKLKRINHCGCQSTKNRRQAHTHHGKTRTPEFNSWQGARDRCLCPTNKAYAYYGGRGIRICERWMSFDNFLQDMGPKPSPRHSLDRINVNGDYCPENCRWATPAEQARNRRNNVRITIDGKTQTLYEFYGRKSSSAYTMANRMIAKGVTPEEAASLCPPK
ncbi:hypothetical protein [Halomonas elongata]|uniref:hypothetical protein n=1 Tax=Halomonas elongata TaxID=2746 RepID=UPI0023B1D587|nr:hypothetical protein [Halomonas elongata]